jgi:hypothetical protein
MDTAWTHGSTVSFKKGVKGRMERVLRKRGKYEEKPLC